MPFTPVTFTDGITPLNKATFDQLQGGVIAAERVENKAAANGYASLDATGKVPVAQLPGASGDELAYAQFTAPVAIPTTGFTPIISAGSVVYVAVPILVEFYAPDITAAAAVSASTSLYLFADGVVSGNLGGVFNPAAAAIQVPVYVARRFTPSAGAHTYEVRGAANIGAGTVSAGDGGSTNPSPGFIRISRA